MPTDFKLEQRLAGYAAGTGRPGEKVPVCYRELIGPANAVHLQQQLDQLHGTLFTKIPQLLDPTTINHLLVVIRPDLSCTAYVNELRIRDAVKTTREMKRGEIVYVGDISDVSSVDLGVAIPTDAGVVLVRSFEWKRSLFFDFGPLLPELGPRAYPIERALAQQALLLLGIPGSESRLQGPKTRLQHMADGLAKLRRLLDDRCQTESSYQELLEEHPWMLGGLYSEIQRHQPLDDRSIPDFTATRCYDQCHDVLELKQPFLKLFRKDGDFGSAFNEAWNQAERYLSFARQQRSYLREEKELRFENPQCLLLIGYGLTDRELRELRKKEGFGKSISVFTYDHLLATALHVYSLMETAGERKLPQDVGGNAAG
jgi:hypothetical protein